jgi:hypothetical protein
MSAYLAPASTHPFKALQPIASPSLVAFSVAGTALQAASETAVMVPRASHAVKETSGKDALSAKLNPMDWNAKTLIPPVGVGVAGLWGVGNILEHLLQDGHLHAPNNFMKPFVKPFLPAATALARITPVLNVAYGATNAMGAMANGYAWRSLAFSLYGAASAALLPLGLKDNKNSLLMQTLKHDLAKAGSEATKKELAVKIAELGVKAAPIRHWINLGNAIVPIGMLLGLFTFTKVAQSTPSVHLKHTHGGSLREMLKGKGEEEPPLWDALKQNFKTETHELQKNFREVGHQLTFGGKAITKGWQQLLHPQSVPLSAEGKRPSAWDRFSTPIMESEAVPLSYALAGTGRVLSAVMAVGLMAMGQKALFTKSSPFELISKTAAVPLAANVGLKTLSSLFLFGQLAGGVSALFTKFTEWDPKLSSFYRTSSVPYILSGASAMAEAFGGRFRPMGFGPSELAKFGAFIQGSSYFWNLTLQQKNKATTPTKEESFDAVQDATLNAAARLPASAVSSITPSSLPPQLLDASSPQASAALPFLPVLKGSPFQPIASFSPAFSSSTAAQNKVLGSPPLMQLPA